MKLIIVFLIIKTASLSSSTADFQVSLELYSKTIQCKEWSIVISREGEKIIIDIDKFRGKTIKKNISKKMYMELLNNLNKKGIWILKDYIRERTPHDFYIVTVKSLKYSNTFRVESGVPLIGENSRYREIIRSITNTAIIVINSI